MQNNILLESGTNELEVIVFSVGGSNYGINVMKVREIMDLQPLTKTPHAHPHVEGLIRVRDEVMAVIDLGKALGHEPLGDTNNGKLIIAELNQLKVAFHVESVSQIYRISWEQIEKPSTLTQGGNNVTIGVVKMESGLVLLLDYEKVVVDISPESGMNVAQIKALGKRSTSEKHIFIAEDSPLLRKLLEETLLEGGYTNLTFFENGREMWEQLAVDGEEPNPTLPDLVITDIEMPQMDGHHLTKRIKDHNVLKQIPVIIFSSLITGDLFHKGEKVGANAQVSKPEIVKLVTTIDALVK